MKLVFLSYNLRSNNPLFMTNKEDQLRDTGKKLLTYYLKNLFFFFQKVFVIR